MQHPPKETHTIYLCKYPSNFSEAILVSRQTVSRVPLSDGLQHLGVFHSASDTNFFFYLSQVNLTSMHMHNSILHKIIVKTPTENPRKGLSIQNLCSEPHCCGSFGFQKLCEQSVVLSFDVKLQGNSQQIPAYYRDKFLQVTPPIHTLYI